MAENCRYEEQLREASRLVAEGVGSARIGPSSTKAAAARRSSRGSSPTSATSSNRVTKQSPIRDVVIVPIGFISDHMEVLFDLDTEVRQLCERLGINMVRAATVGTHPRFVRMIRELIEERMSDSPIALPSASSAQVTTYAQSTAVFSPPKRPAN